jgi:Icc protein
MAVELLQVTDMHLFADPADTILGVPPRLTLEEVVAEARTESWDRVLLTGDLSQDGSAASYKAARELMASLDAPCHWVPGNHDQPSVMQEALDGPPCRAERAFGVGAWRVVMLDTSVADETYGRLSDAALDALDETLSAYPDTPTLIGMHHSPVPVGAAWLDPINLREPASFQQVVTGHSQVQLVLFGHVHQAVEAQWGDTHLYGCPSTCFQFAPGSDEFRVETSDPGFRRIVLRETGEFDVSLHRVPATYVADLESDGY